MLPYMISKNALLCILRLALGILLYMIQLFISFCPSKIPIRLLDMTELETTR